MTTDREEVEGVSVGKACKGIRIGNDMARAINMHKEAMERGWTASFERPYKSQITGAPLLTLADIAGAMLKQSDDGWRYDRGQKDALVSLIDQLAVYDYIDPVGGTGINNLAMVSWREREDRALRTIGEMNEDAEELYAKAITLMETAKRRRKLVLKWQEFKLQDETVQ